MFNRDKLLHLLVGAAIGFASFWACLGVLVWFQGHSLFAGGLACLVGICMAKAAGHLKEAWDERRVLQGHFVDPLDATVTEAGGALSTTLALMVYVVWTGVKHVG
jgi:hypothetical protein